MKKLLSLLLCLAMLVCALASCSEDEAGNTEKADRPNLTLKIAVVVDDNTTAEGIAATQKAFNAKASVDLATKLEFVCFKKSEYETKMREEMERLAGAGVLGSTTTESGAAVDAEGYPVASDTQFDLVLIAGEEMYKEYAANGWILSLDTYLSGTYKKLNTMVIDSAMAYVRAADPNMEEGATTGACYAIPAATTYGKYTYLAVNKEAINKYNIPVPTEDKADFTFAYDVFGRILSEPAATGMQFWVDKYAAEGKSFSPVYNTEASFKLPGVKYLSMNGGFSLMGAYVAAGQTYNQFSQANYQNSKFTMNLLDSKPYQSYLSLRFEALKNEYFGTETEDAFIVGIVKGNYSLRNSEDYHYIVLENPVMQKEEVFDTMLAVSAFTVNKNRSVEILQELMTDDTNNGLLNIALFGVENENYYLEDGAVRLRNSYSYAAHPEYLFGNVVETTYPCVNYGQSANEYDGFANQHNDLVKAFYDESYGNYFYEFTVPEEWKDWNEGDELPEGFTEVPASVLRALSWAKADAYSKTIYDDLMAASDINDFISKYQAYVSLLNDSATENADALNFLQIKGSPIPTVKPDGFPADPYNAGYYDFVGGDATTVGGAFANYILAKVNENQ